MREGTAHEFNELCNLIDENHVISFDIYDTALLRNVLFPTDIFDLVQIEIDKVDLPIRDFKKMRIRAEKKARTITRSDDIRYDEIYELISKKIGEDFANRIKEFELQIERKFTTVNPFIKKVYDYAVSRGKTVLFVSDMYLEPSFVREILELNGYDEYDGLYVSGHVGFSKASKGLYDYIRQKHKICDKWLHIGDNPVSDYWNALECGLNAYNYKSPRDRTSLPRRYSIGYSIIKAIQINHCETVLEDPGYWYKFGVNIVSPMFFGFTNWLVNELKEKSNVYFLARDGYLPWQLYKKFTQFVDGLPESRYIYASRKVFQLSTLPDMEMDEAIEFLVYSNENLGQKKSVLEILEDVGIKLTEHHLALLKKFDLHPESWLLTKEEVNKMKRFLKVIFSEVRTCLEHNKQLVAKYLRQNAMHEYDEVNIVDVGWRGSTQKAIKEITKQKITGYYFGTSYNVYDEIRSEVRSYSFHLGKPIQLMQRIMDNVMMFEFVFSAPHGVLTGLSNISGNVTPVLSEVNTKHSMIIDQIQSGVMRIMDDYLRHLEYLKNVPVHEALMDYLEFIKSKKYTDLLRFKELSMTVGFGERSAPLQFVSCVSIYDYLRNRKRIEKAASKNLWKNAIIVEGSAEEFNKKTVRANKIFTKDRLIKAIKNPGKAYRYMLRLIRNK